MDIYPWIYIPYISSDPDIFWIHYGYFMDTWRYIRFTMSAIYLLNLKLQWFIKSIISRAICNYYAIVIKSKRKFLVALILYCTTCNEHVCIRVLNRVTPRLKRGERRFLATEFLFKILFQKWRLFCCRLDSFFGGVFDLDHDWTWRFRLRFWLQVLDQTSSIPIPPRFLMSFAMKTLSLRLKRRSLRLKVPSPFLNKIKTWLRIFLEPNKNKFRVWSQLKTERFQERK